MVLEGKEKKEFEKQLNQFEKKAQIYSTTYAYMLAKSLFLEDKRLVIEAKILMEEILKQFPLKEIYKVAYQHFLFRNQIGNFESLEQGNWERKR